MKKQNDQVESLIDRALGEYADAEPRAGLEQRILARVRTDMAVTEARARWIFPVWWGGFGVAAAVVAVMLVSFGTRPLGRPASVASVTSGVQTRGSGTGQQKTLERLPMAGKHPRTSLRSVAAAGERSSVRPAPDALPKLEMFPAPATVDMFPRPIEVSERERQLAALRSEKVDEALVALQQEQNEPIRIAAIQISLIQMDEDTGRNQ